MKSYVSLQFAWNLIKNNAASWSVLSWTYTGTASGWKLSHCLHLSKHLPFNITYSHTVLLWAVEVDIPRWQIILSQKKYLSRYLSFPMVYRQTGWLVQARYLRMTELNPSLSQRVFVFPAKLLWLGENSIFSNAWTHYELMAAVWVALRHASGFSELEKPLDV